jgi:tRNA G18 (ribose-2'-O)-methylase SpoU
MINPHFTTIIRTCRAFSIRAITLPLMQAGQATLKKKKKKARGGKVQIWLFDASQWPEMLDRVEKRILW